MIQRLFRKFFQIQIRLGLDADLPNFLKSAVQGEPAFTTDSNRVLIATSDAGATDAGTVELAKSQSVDEESAGRALTMADNSKLIPVDTSGGSVVFTIADGALEKNARIYFVKTNASNNLSFDPATNTKINDVADTQVDKTTAFKLLMLWAFKDDELLLIEV